MPHNELKAVEGFLENKRLAVVGVSRNERDFTRVLFRAFLERGYDAVPVNPQLTEADGKSAVAHVADISPAVDQVLVLTPPPANKQVVEECVAAGIKRVWLYGAVTHGASTPDAVEACDRAGVTVVAGECPFMFLHETGFIHTLHGCIRRLTGQYPK